MGGSRPDWPISATRPMRKGRVALRELNRALTGRHGLPPLHTGGLYSFAQASEFALRHSDVRSVTCVLDYSEQTRLT